MSDIFRHMPFEVPEQFRRFLQSGEPGSWLRVEEFEDGSTMVIRAELPGIDPDRDVDITVAADRLTIDAQRKERSEDHDKPNYRSEFRYGSIRRSFPLPYGVQEDDIKASYQDGVLEIRVPRHDQQQTPGRKVRVSRTDSSGRGNDPTHGSSSGNLPGSAGTGTAGGDDAGMPGTPPPPPAPPYEI